MDDRLTWSLHLSKVKKSFVNKLNLLRKSKWELGTTKDIKQYLNFVVASDIPRAISKEELVKATENDEEL